MELEGLSVLLIQIQQFAAEFGFRILISLVILIVGRWLAGFIQKFVRRILLNSSIETTLASFLVNATYYTTLTFVVLIALGQVGIETTSLLAVLGTAGLAVGLALQGSFANVASGLLLVFFKPLKVGDWVEVNDVSGIVEEVQLFTTIICTLDNRTVIIPNSQLTGENIVNYSLKEKLRLDLVVGVSYNDDIDQVKALIRDVLSHNEKVLSYPEPTVGLLELGDNSINFAVRPWVKPSDYYAVQFATYEAIKKRFDQEGVSIPFPQRDIHIITEKIPPSLAEALPTA